MLIALNFSLVHFTYSQHEPIQLTIGDKFPNISFDNLLNYHKSSLNISDLKGKLVIFDLWNHYCLPCIRSFGKLDSLQKSFSEQIQIVLVNKESKDSTLHFFSKRKHLKMPSIPMITSDSLFAKLFNPRGYPYHIWVDKGGIIKYISGGSNTSESHIRNFLRGDDIHLSNITARKSGSIFENVTFPIADEITYYSYLLPCTGKINIGDTEVSPYNNGKAIRISSNCSSVLDLLKKAYREYSRYDFDESYSVFLNENDTCLIATLQSKADKKYSYDLVVPIEKQFSAYSAMQQDLKRYFEIDAVVEMKKMKSLILVKKDNLNKLRTKGGKPVDTFMGSTHLHPVNDSIRYLQNQPFDKLTRWLHLWLKGSQPFFNDVSYLGNIDIALKDSSITNLNIKLLKRELNWWGLDLIEDIRYIPVLVLKSSQTSIMN